MNLSWLLISFLVVFALLPTSTFAMRHTLNIKRDHRTHFLIEKFGFQAGGHLSLNITHMEPQPHPLRAIKVAGVFITISKAEFVNFVFPSNKCPFIRSSKSIDDGSSSSRELLDYFDGANPTANKPSNKYQTMSFQVKGSSLIIDQDVTEETAGLWSLYWVVCATEQPTYSFNLKLAQWNVLPNGQRSYLPTGELPLPYIYGFFSFICFGLLVFWVGYFLRATNRKVNAVHYMMTVLLFFKILSLFCQAFMYGTLARTGDAAGWNIAYYVFQSLRAVALFTVILMIGTGWSFLKPFLSDNDKKLFFIVLPLQVLANIALVITEETMPGSSNWIFWLYFFRAIDIICCAAILIPIVTSMNHLKGAAQSDGKARKSLEKLILFRRFYLIIICYIYFTRIVVLLLNSTLPYQRTWVGPLFAEIAAVTFYVITGHQFRPIRDNPYFQVEQDESDQLELRAIEAIQNEDI